MLDQNIVRYLIVLKVDIQPLGCRVGNNMGSLEVRMLPYPPSFGLIKTKNNTSEDMIIEIYPHHTGYDNPPIFEVNKQTDPNYFQYFSTQFNAMWDRAEIYNKSNI